MRIGILGTGLIGTSIGLGLSVAGWEVHGWDPDPDTLQRSAERSALHPRSDPVDLIAAECDLVVLAGPPSAVLESVATLDPGPGLLIDVTGVKGPVIAAAAGRRFVGTHPMAGREVSGPEAATADLFRGAAWVVTTDAAAEADMVTVERMIAALGARAVRMTAADHDVAVAVVSHLPQLLASTLMNEAADRTDALELVAGSFRDLTRVAASDPAPWVELFDANRGPILDVLGDFLQRLTAAAAAIQRRDGGDIADHLDHARSNRLGLAAPVVGITVALADRPGEARPGRPCLPDQRSRCA